MDTGPKFSVSVFDTYQLVIDGCPLMAGLLHQSSKLSNSAYGRRIYPSRPEGKRLMFTDGDARLKRGWWYCFCFCFLSLATIALLGIASLYRSPRWFSR